MLTKRAKKMLLLLSEENPLWDIVISPRINLGRIAKYCVVPNGTFDNWRKGKEQNPAKVREVLATIRQKIKDQPQHVVWGDPAQPVCRVLKEPERVAADNILNSFERLYFDDKVTVYQVALELFGMSLDTCQIIIDKAVYAQHPLLVSLYYSKDEIGESFQHYRGVYHLWVRRYTRWFQCPLRVRYILNINGQPAIRCKLNFPIVSPERGERHWEYDGFFLARDSRIYWIFEKRQERRRDHFYFVTDDGRGYNDGALTLSGTYLTAGQDAAQSIASDDVIMQRIEKDDVEIMTKLMHSTVNILEGDDCHRIEQLLQGYRLDDHMNKGQASG